MLSLGCTPLANSLLPAEGGESQTYPLDLVRCTSCGLVQLAQIVAPDALFSDYVYFSSNSDTMVRHAREMVNWLVERERLGAESLAIEIASNDGYLLQHFLARGVPVLGIEPAQNIARAANERGIRTLAKFFGADTAHDLARQGTCADVIIGNNVLAHVPELNDFLSGVRTLLRPSGVAVFEVPYLRDMLEQVEFDTIYHEHQCYFSLTALASAFSRHDLEVVDVDRVPIHGGSLRVSVAPSGQRAAEERVRALLAEEADWGVMDNQPYVGFAQSVHVLRAELRQMLERLKGEGAHIAAYGAAAKGVTLTSFCGIGRNYLDFVVDRSPHKQGRGFPVDGLPIYAPEALLEKQPEYALLLTWNFLNEIVRQQSEWTERGGRFIVPVPKPHTEPVS